MDVVVQSFGEFKSAQMADAADNAHTLARYVLADNPSQYKGPRSVLKTYRWLRYLQAAGIRLHPTTDLSSYWTNKLLDWLAAKKTPDCDLFVGYSGSCLKSLQNASSGGATTVVYRGAPHGQFFLKVVDRLLKSAGFDGVKRNTKRLTPREHREYKRADFVWVPSRFTADSLVSYGVSEEKIKILPYGVDVDQFEPTDHQTDTFDILYVGGVTPEKGVHVLLDAMAELGDVQATLVGKISDRLQPQIRNRENVNAIGWIERTELIKYYQQASVFVFPSLADGYPSAVIEALACGCPVITTSNVGTRELIMEYDAGRVVEPGSSDAIFNAVKAVRDDPALRREMRTGARVAMDENDFGLEERREIIGEFMHSLRQSDQ